MRTLSLVLNRYIWISLENTISMKLNMPYLCVPGLHNCGNIPGLVSTDSWQGRSGEASLLHTPEPSRQDGCVSWHIQLTGLDLLHHGFHTPVSGSALFRGSQHILREEFVTSASLLWLKVISSTSWQHRMSFLKFKGCWTCVLNTEDCLF